MSLCDLLDAPHALHALPPVTQWYNPVFPFPPLPLFFKLSDVIPLHTLRNSRRYLAAINRCFQLAAEGKVAEAVKKRLPPLRIKHKDMFTEAARGFGVLDLRKVLAKTGPVGQLLSSQFPHDKPNSELNPDFFLWFCEPFPDLEIIAHACHGTPDRASLPLETVLCFPAVTALHNIAVVAECTDKDEKLGFTSEPFEFCPTWPFIGDAVSVHWRNQAARLCWDKSGPRKVPGWRPFNERLPLEDLPIIAYVTITHSARDVAVWDSSGLEVRMFKCDLSKAYRRAGRQRSDIWKQGRVTMRGCTVDFRGQFGDASQPNTANRTWQFCVWVARRLIRALEALFPAVDPLLLAWIGLRSSEGKLVTLGDVWAFFDDVHGGAINDAIVAQSGELVRLESGETLTRAVLYYEAVMCVFEAAGFSFGADKKVPPTFTLELLGALLRVKHLQIVVHPEKRPRYIEQIRELRVLDWAPREEFNSLAHKLIYCSCIIVRMRPLLFPVFKCLHAPTRTSRVKVSVEAKEALERCENFLTFADAHSLPFASLEKFPSLGDGIVVSYADAAGEGLWQGWGFWWVEGNTCFFAFNEWSDSQKQLVIHAKEAWVTTAAVMSIKAVNSSVSFVLEYTDNAATEWVADSQASRCVLLQEIISARARFFDAADVCTLPQRVKSEHNIWADWLSRGQIQKFIAAVCKCDLKPCQVPLVLEASNLLESLLNIAKRAD